MSHNNNKITNLVDRTPPRKALQARQQSNNCAGNNYDNKSSSVPLSPLSAAESFFTSTILGVSPEHREKVALAASNSVRKKKSHKRIHSSSSSVTHPSIPSLCTTFEDFETALDLNDEHSRTSDNEHQEYDEVNKIFRTKRSLFPTEESSFSDEVTNFRLDRNMTSSETSASTTSTMLVSNAPTVEDTSEPPVSDETPFHYDLTENIYEKAKSVWIWGKTIKSVSPIMDAAEDLATKVVQSAIGMEDLDTVDKTIKPHLSGFDKNTLSPAIAKILEFITPIIKKGDEAMKPIATTVGGYVLGPFGLIKPPPSIENTTEGTLTQ